LLGLVKLNFIIEFELGPIRLKEFTTKAIGKITVTELDSELNFKSSIGSDIFNPVSEIKNYFMKKKEFFTIKFNIKHY
jgi:hypothetical protein